MCVCVCVFARVYVCVCVCVRACVGECGSSMKLVITVCRSCQSLCISDRYVKESLAPLIIIVRREQMLLHNAWFNILDLCIMQQSDE